MNGLREFFENLALKWDASQPPDREAVINSLFGRFDEALGNIDSILDVGTGTGALIPILKQRYPKAKIFSIDFAHQMCLRASRRTAVACVTQSDVHALPFPESRFDAVICHNCFPHFLDKPLALESLKRVIKQSQSGME